MKLSIILPIYNPSQVWAEQVCAKLQQIEQLQLCAEVELIVVNDGSENSFFLNEKKMLLSQKNIHLIEYETNKGKGFALRKGVQSASGDRMIYTDIDFPYTLESFVAIFNSLSTNDVVIGIKDRSYYTHVPKSRVWISKLLRFFIKTLLRIPTDDTQCGLKGFNQKGKNVFLQTTIDRYLFDLEFVWLCAQNKHIKLQPIEVKLRPDISFRRMNYKIILTEGMNFIQLFLTALFRK